MVNLRANPFFLDDEGVKWVEDTIASMTVEEKIGQLFCPVGFTTDENVLKGMLDKGIGGMMYRSGPGAETQKNHRFLQANAKIPLLLAANLEAGGTGVAADGTDFAKPLQVAATDDPEQAYRLGYISCSEGAAVGCNWSFAPIVDIDMNWRNPITNLRTFGSDPKRVLAMGAAYMRGADEAGLAVSIKHFPGDGVDERDQHLHTTVNSLSADEWTATYGMVYKGLIDKGAKTVMVAHIAQPDWAKKLNPALTEKEAHLPATLSKELMSGLLRGELGFNGLVVTDATPMLGFTCAMPRRDAVPYSISTGVDMFLFNKSFDEDYEYMLDGYKNGVITEERLRDALLRILGVKASLGLHVKAANGTLVPGPEALDILGNDKFTAWARECADKAVTLVKDTGGILPVTPEKYKRVALFVSEGGDYFGATTGLEDTLKKEFEARGFEIVEPPAGGFTDKPVTVADFKSSIDLAIFAFDFPTASNNTVIRLIWKGGLMGGSTPWFSAEVPTMAVSFANPYHLFDVPQVSAMVNAYTNNKYVIPAALDKITGKSEFKGKSPVDPFCGCFDATL
ncbi:MAG: glycoside hydrolase family 3 protein [Oscillospiraceae bacterium]|jgi:beta-N-acetylhexosaminidase|nr:glycoside hydrolase family 3 protein [Oscillospiraceae bacterium]